MKPSTLIENLWKIEYNPSKSTVEPSHWMSVNSTTNKKHLDTSAVHPVRIPILSTPYVHAFCCCRKKRPLKPKTCLESFIYSPCRGSPAETISISHKHCSLGRQSAGKNQFGNSSDNYNFWSKFRIDNRFGCSWSAWKMCLHSVFLAAAT